MSTAFPWKRTSRPSSEDGARSRLPFHGGQPQACHYVSEARLPVQAGKTPIERPGPPTAFRNVPSDVWFYPWADSDLSGFFGADETQWRSGTRAPITHLRLLLTPVDWVSQQPDSVVIESADAVKVGMGPR